MKHELTLYSLRDDLKRLTTRRVANCLLHWLYTPVTQSVTTINLLIKSLYAITYHWTGDVHVVMNVLHNIFYKYIPNNSDYPVSHNLRILEWLRWGQWANNALISTSWYPDLLAYSCAWLQLILQCICYSSFSNQLTLRTILKAETANWCQIWNGNFGWRCWIDIAVWMVLYSLV